MSLEAASHHRGLDEADDSPIHVLHVDDDPSVLEVTRMWLERESDAITVRSEQSAVDALDVLDDDVECIVSDYAMPELDGLAFLREVRARKSDLPFILFTGKGTEEIAADAIRAGVTDYVQKGDTDAYVLLANDIEQFVAKYRTEQVVERRLQALETAREGISILDEDGRFIYVNGAYAELYGYVQDELLGQHWEILYPEGDVEYARTEILPVVREEGRWSGETVHVRKDGSRLLTSHALSAADNGTLICVVRDISGERETERLLAEERERFSLLLEAITEYAIFSLDPNGYITSWHSGSERIDGYSPDEILGEHVSVLYTDEDAAADLPAHHLARAREEGPVHEEGRRVERDGMPFWVDFTLTAVWDDDRHRGFVCVMRDMTDRAQRERQLQRRLEQLDQFASVLSHDLRNPLSVATASLELAREDATGADEHLDRIERALARIDDLIESLLVLAREGEVVNEFESVSLERTAERAWDVVDTADARLVVDDTGTIRADAERLQTLFENLFSNAIAHAGSDVTVRVGALAAGFYVEDDGPGIPADERERVFEHGYSTGGEGVGVGLGIVESIASAHGWDVALRDGTTGGARFEFTETLGRPSVRREY